jgi:hypothetical protein
VVKIFLVGLSYRLYPYTDPSRREKHLVQRAGTSPSGQ